MTDPIREAYDEARRLQPSKQSAPEWEALGTELREVIIRAYYAGLHEGARIAGAVEAFIVQASAGGSRAMTDKQTELKLLDYARRAAVHAELAGTMETYLAKVSTDVARNAFKDVLEAID